MSKFSNIIKYWNNNVLEFNNSNFKQNIIDAICLECEYDRLSITNSGKKKNKKHLCIKDRDLYTPSMGINKELPYLKKLAISTSKLVLISVPNEIGPVFVMKHLFKNLKMGCPPDLIFRYIYIYFVWIVYDFCRLRS